ncbi:MAG: Uncharacterised protein [Flavobacterium sp. SCGC AAA160-P02]|nr:MAG: Uncharacterised protein [Flavobacterium sp. SCGC AAA160-P02]
MESTIIKDIEEKSIVWFKHSNQYVIVEKIAAFIIEKLCKNVTIQEIAKELEERLKIPSKEAIRFVKDLKEQLINPMQTANNHQKLESPLSKVPSTFAFEKYYRMHSKVFKVAFSNEFEVSLIHPKFAHLEIKTAPKIDFFFQIFNDSQHTFLSLDNAFIGSWTREDIHYFQGKFSMKIIECIYEKKEEKWMGVFHASAINYKDEALLVLGDSGNGKSTSLALLQAQGFQCLADDFVPVDITKKIHTFPAGISIKKNSLPVLLDHYPELKSATEYQYTRLNKIVRYLPPKNSDYHTNYPCKALVFIKYDANIDCDISKISKLEAFEQLVPDSWISPEAENANIFLTWFSSLPCYQLTYSNNEMMYDAIKRIFDNEV